MNFDLCNLESLKIRFRSFRLDEVSLADITKFFEILFTKSNIKYFDFDKDYNESFINDLSGIDHSRFGFLKGLSIKGGIVMGDKFNYNHILSNLESIHLEPGCYSQHYNPQTYETIHLNKDVILNNLREICLSMSNLSDIKILNGKLNNLKLERIHVYSDKQQKINRKLVSISPTEKRENEFLEEFETLIKLPSINYIGIDAIIDSFKLFDGLLNLPNKSKQHLKINVLDTISDTLGSITWNLEEILDRVEKGCLHFMLIYSAWIGNYDIEKEDEERLQKLVKEWNCKYLYYKARNSCLFTF